MRRFRLEWALGLLGLLCTTTQHLPSAGAAIVTYTATDAGANSIDPRPNCNNMSATFATAANADT